MKKTAKIQGKVDCYNSGYTEDNYCYVGELSVIDFFEKFHDKQIEIAVKVKSNLFAGKYKWINESDNKDIIHFMNISEENRGIVATVSKDDEGDWGYSIPDYAEMCCFKTKREAKLIVQKIISARDKIK
jgi:predicted RNA-binding protein with EMAP domain